MVLTLTETKNEIDRAEFMSKMLIACESRKLERHQSSHIAQSRIHLVKKKRLAESLRNKYIETFPPAFCIVGKGQHVD